MCDRQYRASREEWVGESPFTDSCLLIILVLEKGDSDVKEEI